MTSIGRGRGWIIQNQNKDLSLRRPGSTSTIYANNNIVRDIIDKITAYDLSEDISPQLIQEIADLMTSAIDKGILKDTCDILLKQAILDESLTKKVAVIFSEKEISLIKDNGEAIRKHFLSFLQENYMSRDKDRIHNREAFVNKAILHAEVYYRMRVSQGSRLKVLAQPLIDYLEDLLQDKSKNHINFTMIQIFRSGKDIYGACPDRLESLMMKIRQRLVKESDYSPQDRAMLLLMIELANNNYKIKDIQLKQFYLSNIKGLSFEYPFYQEDLKVIAQGKTENGNQLQEVDNNQQVIKEEMKNDIFEEGNYSKSSNVPRAIRGSGALNKNKSKEGDNINTKLNSLKITQSKQKNNKGWDHDDRFHKDYE